MKNEVVESMRSSWRSSVGQVVLDRMATRGMMFSSNRGVCSSLRMAEFFIIRQELLSNLSRANVQE